MTAKKTTEKTVEKKSTTEVKSKVKKTAEKKSKEIKKQPVEQKVENLPKVEALPKVEEKPQKKPSAGKQIRDLFESIVPKLKDEHLEILTSQEKTKDVLKIRYPFLKEVKNEKDERKINNCPRYGKNTVKINDKDYYICNDLYERNIEIFKKWCETLK